MKIMLITGGAGFIGSHFVRYVLNTYRDYRVINLDKLTYAGNLDNLLDVVDNPRYEFVRGDICDAGLVNELMQRVDLVVNFAAESHVDRSIMGAEEFMKSNALGVYTLLAAARDCGVERFLQVSTDEVYGSLEEGEDPWTEDAPDCAAQSLCGGESIRRSYGAGVCHYVWFARGDYARVQ